MPPRKKTSNSTPDPDDNGRKKRPLDNRVEEQLTNDASEFIAMERPYCARITIEGTAPLLMHAWSVVAVQEKADAKKGSEAKKTDNIESYVYRDKKGFLGVPGTAFHATLAHAAKFVQDPRSPRKSAMDLVKAAIIPLDDVALFHAQTKDWDYLDQRRVVVQRNSITRTRPAMNVGWKITFNMMVTLPHYISPILLRQLITDGGKLVGLLDFRPTFGRFDMVNFDIPKQT